MAMGISYNPVVASFWDMHSQLKGRGGRRGDGSGESADHAPPAAAQEPAVLTVSALTARIRNVLLSGLPGTIIVRGEVSEWSSAPSGHRYFCLKDDRTSLACVMWRADAAMLRFEPKIGQELVAHGTIDVYSARGEYQLKVHRLEPFGQGSLDLAFRQLVEKLDREGLFDNARKKPLPRYPRRIAIVTSPRAAGYQDVLKVLRSCGCLELFIYPVPVQGAGAAGQIAEALEHLSRRHGDIGGLDAVMLVRGGGSAEDLWVFNEEPVARALAGMSVPVITGIGHQTDRTIADRVADVEAHTPTEAATVLVRQWKQAAERIDHLGVILRRDVRRIHQAAAVELARSARRELFRRPAELVQRRRQRVDKLGFDLAGAFRQIARRTSDRLRAWGAALVSRHPRQQAALWRQRIDSLSGRLATGYQRQSSQKASRLASLARHLAAVDPTAVLSRGYSLTVVERTDRLLRSADEVRAGDVLLTQTADGTVRSTVGSSRQGKLFE